MKIAGLIELELRGRGPKRGFVFDPHRLALSAWGQAGVKNAVLVTFDRHFDLLAPTAAPPAAPWSPEQIDAHARNDLDPRNVDHILAAAQLGIVSHVIAIARTTVPGAVTAPRWHEHEIVRSPTLAALTDELGVTSDEGQRAWGLLERASQIVLDFDLDCFTSPSDADPRTTLGWSAEVIREYLFPEGSERWWNLVLSKCVALTFAREPGHCGGLISAGRLFEAAAQVVFVEILKADLP